MTLINTVDEIVKRVNVIHQITTKNPKSSLDLDEKLAEICRTFSALNCPDDFHLRVRLVSDSQTLFGVTHSTYALEQGTQISLPTPTLVGLPQDESGFRPFIAATLSNF
jgi:hypothetical protein